MPELPRPIDPLEASRLARESLEAVESGQSGDHSCVQALEAKVNGQAQTIWRLREWIEQQECGCRFCGKADCKSCNFLTNPCSRCQLVVTWDRTKASGHPGLKKESEVG